MTLRDRNKDLFKDKGEYSYIWVNLPDALFQETLDVRLLGNNRYQVLQIPFYAENLNQFDIVECRDSGEAKREFVRVVEFSGYRTVHMEFAHTVTRDMWLKHMLQLENMGADWRNSGRHFSISTPPSPQHDEILRLLQGWEQQTILKIEAVNTYSNTD